MKTITRLRLIAAALGLVLGTAVAGSALAAGEQKEPRDFSWSFSGPFGTFDKAQVLTAEPIAQQLAPAASRTQDE